MATYKAEFLAHYYEGRVRPRHAYAFGWIHIWSKLASYAPTIANFFTQTPGLSAIAKWMAGMEQKRHIPPFAPMTFKDWFKAHEPKAPGGQQVILFADTFNNFYHPETAVAAVEVLEDAGFSVQVPMQDLCCGRPLYDYGFLGMARRWLLDIIEKLQPQIEAGVPIVVLEPSCWAVFKEELTNMLPNDRDAQRLSAQTFTLSDFLKNKAPRYRVPHLHKKALLHGHCHQKSLDRLNDKTFGKMFNEKHVLKEMGVDLREPETGCCGMAGAFGFEQGDHYDVSIKCGERVLIPEVNQSGDEDLIIADGFSCREQIQQTTPRTALHLAQVLQMALKQGPTGPIEERPESRLVKQRAREHQLAGLRVAGYFAAGAVAGSIIYGALRKRTDRLLGSRSSLTR